MRRIVKLLVAELVVITAAVALISGTYIFVLPRHFDDRRTYSVLIVGLAVAAVVSGYVASREWAAPPLRRWSITLAISGSVTAAILLLSLFFILNSRGS